MLALLGPEQENVTHNTLGFALSAVAGGSGGSGGGGGGVSSLGVPVRHTGPLKTKS